MDKNYSCLGSTRRLVGFGAAITVLAWSLTLVVVAPAGAYPGTGEYDYQAPFRCGETWQGQTYDTMRIGTRVLRGHGQGNNLAVDFNRRGDLGAAVLASATGYAYVGWSPSGLGNYIIIDHGGGYHSVYAHLGSVWIRAGQFVRRGTAIGAVGSTGASSAPHLHYEQRYNGVSQQVRFNGQAVPVAYEPYRSIVTSGNC